MGMGMGMGMASIGNNNHQGPDVRLLVLVRLVLEKFENHAPTAH